MDSELFTVDENEHVHMRTDSTEDELLFRVSRPLLINKDL